MKMKRHFVLSMLCIAGMLLGHAVTIHTIGDSTMANYDESTTQQRGWGQMLQQFFGNGAVVNNRAKAGASSKSFYLEAPYWTTVKTQIEEGDYVLIQFAHNDEKNNGLDGDTVRAVTGDQSVDYRGTTAQGTYKTYLRKYVEKTRALGATPIFVAPMCRKYFSSNTIRRSGRHDLGDKFSVLNADGTITESSVPESDNTYDYPYAMQQVAQELNVPFIDLTTASADLYLEYGESYCTELLFMPDDGTHTTALGATLIARLAVQGLAEQNLLTQYINASSDLLINPSEIDFSDMYVGQISTKEITLSGFDLTPEAGTFNVTVSEGFELSTDKETYVSQLTLTYTNGNLDFTRLYVRYQPMQAGGFSGTLTISNGTISKELPISGNAIQLQGGTQVLAYWDLTSNEEAELEGPATIVEESWSGMEVQKYSAPNANTTWPAESGFTTERKTQRNLIVGGTWPAGEIDEVSTRYIQFGIQANQATELNIDSIGLYVGGAGGNGMRCRVWYSLNEDFSNAVAIADYSTSMVSNTMYAVSATPVVRLTAGETLYLRIYPWYNNSSAATGKTLCLSAVTIRGVATADATSGVGITEQNLEVKAVEYYAIDGRQLGKEPQQGIYIVRKQMSDGSVRVTKMLK